MALADKTVEVAVRGTVPGNELWVNVHHCDLFGSAPDDPLTAVEATLVAGHFEDLYTALDTSVDFHEDWTVDTIVVRRISGAGGAIITTGESYEFAQTIVGANAAHPLPPQLAVVVTKKTGLAGRSNRGRCYLSGFTESHVSDPARITTTVAGDIADDFVSFQAALAGDDWFYSVLSRTNVAMVRVNQFRVGTAIDTQRRRRNRLVENYQTRLI